jgi:putative transposase
VEPTRHPYPRRTITDKIWKLLEPHLKEIRDGRGTKPQQSQKDFLEAVVYLIRTGAPWRDLPAELGNWHSIYCRFRRWEKAGYWLKLWERLSRQEMGQILALFIDSTTVRAHQHAAGAPKKTARHRLWDALVAA